jgi:hypothetical protein
MTAPDCEGSFLILHDSLKKVADTIELVARSFRFYDLKIEDLER